MSPPLTLKKTSTTTLATTYIIEARKNGMIIATSDKISATPTIAAEVRTFTLPDTGQIICYDTVGTVIDCANTGQDGAFSVNPMSYTDNGGGTFTDNITGLIWQKTDDNITRNWAAAGSYCASLTLGDSSNWRLPTTNELMSLIDYSVASPKPYTVRSYWSSSTHAIYRHTAWVVSLVSSSIGSINKDYDSNILSVRCVR